jgi:D-alanyl-D-alanine dipeptidase
MSSAGWNFYKKEWWHYQLFNAKKYKLIKNNMLEQPIM